MRNINLLIVALISLSLSCSKSPDSIPEKTDGYNMLLIGNSFFRPYAEKFNDMALNSGFENHTATTVFRGGENGRPINFWNDATSNEHNEIKMVLDQGDVEFFGMTAGLLPDNPTDGFREWIDYALQNNPNITIFLSIPPPDKPANWEQLAQDMGFSSIQDAYTYFVNESVHGSLVDELRAEFPSTSIFTIPTGWATLTLQQMNLDNLLLDNIEMSGPVETSIFTDLKGHQGDIVTQTGGLMWLSSIYKVDLSTRNIETGFNTDLHAIAADILSEHDSNYSN